MRTLVLVLILACGFGAAALWQQKRTQRLREERALAAQISAGNAAMTPSGLLGEGEAVVVIGRPARSGASPTTPVAPTVPTVVPPNSPVNGGGVVDPKAKAPVPQPAATDVVVEVGPGQSLSNIAHDHYGHAPVDLVTKLAAYNGMADANALRSGMKLKLPTLERLGVVLKP